MYGIFFVKTDYINFYLIFKFIVINQQNIQFDYFVSHQSHQYIFKIILVTIS